jgi:hypothetical protein
MAGGLRIAPELFSGPENNSGALRGPPALHGEPPGQNRSREPPNYFQGLKIILRPPGRGAGAGQVDGGQTRLPQGACRPQSWPYRACVSEAPGWPVGATHAPDVAMTMILEVGHT